jgi:hypothetical protein
MAAGTGTTVPQLGLGHLTFFPAAESGAVSFVEQPGQVTVIGMRICGTGEETNLAMNRL